MKLYIAQKHTSKPLEQYFLCRKHNYSYYMNIRYMVYICGQQTLVSNVYAAFSCKYRVEPHNSTQGYNCTGAHTLQLFAPPLCTLCRLPSTQTIHYLHYIQLGSTYKDLGQKTFSTGERRFCRHLLPFFSLLSSFLIYISKTLCSKQLVCFP